MGGGGSKSKKKEAKESPGTASPSPGTASPSPPSRASSDSTAPPSAAGVPSVSAARARGQAETRGKPKARLVAERENQPTPDIFSPGSSADTWQRAQQREIFGAPSSRGSTINLTMRSDLSSRESIKYTFVDEAHFVDGPGSAGDCPHSMVPESNAQEKALMKGELLCKVFVAVEASASVPCYMKITRDHVKALHSKTRQPVLSCAFAKEQQERPMIVRARSSDTELGFTLDSAEGSAIALVFQTYEEALDCAWVIRTFQKKALGFHSDADYERGLQGRESVSSVTSESLGVPMEGEVDWDDVAAVRSAARAAYSNGDEERAVLQYRRVAELCGAPPDFEAHVSLGALLSGCRATLNAAADHYALAVEADPSNFVTLVALISTRVRAGGELHVAINAAWKALSVAGEEGSDAWVIVEPAVDALGHSDLWEDARNFVRKVHAMQPHDSATGFEDAMKMVDMKESTHRRERALREFHDAAGGTCGPHVEADLLRVLELSPDDDSVAFILGSLYESDHRYVSAVNLFRPVAGSGREHAEEACRRMAACAVHVGSDVDAPVRKDGQRGAEAALEALGTYVTIGESRRAGARGGAAPEQALEASEKALGMFEMTSWAVSEAKAYHTARHLLMTAAAVWTDAADQLFDLKSRWAAEELQMLKREGAEARAMDDLPTAVDKYGAALLVDSRDFECHVVLGEIATQLRSYDEGELHYREAIGISALSPLAHEGLLFNLHAREVPSPEKVLGALVRFLDLCLQIVDSPLRGWEASVWSFVALDEIALGREYVEKLSAVFPEIVPLFHVAFVDAQVTYYRGRGHQCFEDYEYDDAIVFFGKVLDLRSDFEASFWLAVTLAALNRTPQAAQHLTVATENSDQYARYLAGLGQTKRKQEYLFVSKQLRKIHGYGEVALLGTTIDVPAAAVVPGTMRGEARASAYAVPREIPASTELTSTPASLAYTATYKKKHRHRKRM